ncbi:MAG: DUF2892 domain-containing protein [Patescibacteria group bacterium]|jgi:hypothetical protein
MNMEKNVGKTDRWIRGILGIALIIIGFSMTGGTLMYVLGAVGAISLLTAIFGFCPAYKVLGISTNKQKPASPQARI